MRCPPASGHFSSERRYGQSQRRKPYHTLSAFRGHPGWYEHSDRRRRQLDGWGHFGCRNHHIQQHFGNQRRCWQDHFRWTHSGCRQYHLGRQHVANNDIFFSGGTFNNTGTFTDTNAFADQMTSSGTFNNSGTSTNRTTPSRPSAAASPSTIPARSKSMPGVFNVAHAFTNAETVNISAGGTFQSSCVGADCFIIQGPCRATARFKPRPTSFG